MWYVTTYQPVSMISLKTAAATSTGGKSLLLPTPFAFKMALLDMVIQQVGASRGELLWGSIRDAQVAIRGPRHITVNNTFTKIMKPMKGRPSLDPDTGLIPPMIKTIAFREYVFWDEPIQVGVKLGDDLPGAWMQWLSHVSYIGKRGGFIQAVDVSVQQETLSAGYTILTDPSDGFDLNGTLQVMDDCSPELTYEHVDIYSSKNMRIGKDRILRPIVLPYRQTQASRGYTLYERMG